MVFTMHWDGISWKPVPTPRLGAFSSRFDGVRAESANNVWAIGSVTALAGGCCDDPISTLIERWNGSSWSVVPSPNALGPIAYLWP